MRIDYDPEHHGRTQTMPKELMEAEVIYITTERFGHERTVFFSTRPSPTGDKQ